MSSRKARLLSSIAAVAVLMTGCGLPARQVSQLDRNTVPFGLLATATPTITPQAGGPQTTVFFVANDHLVAVTRRVVGENVPAEAARSLAVGPTVAESAHGLSTDVPAQTRIISLDLARSVATVELSSEFGDIGGSDQVLAVAQFVYTLTASRYIDAVRFAIDGKFIEVPDASGSLSSAPRSRSDYKSVAPRSS